MEGILRNLAIIGMIDTPQMRVAIKAVTGISDIHKWALCSCLPGIQQKLIDCMDIESIMAMRYQDIMSKIEPTEDSLTEDQRKAILGAMAACLLETIDGMKSELVAQYTSVPEPTA